MNFKKRVNGSWTDAPHYIHNTSTDTLTTLPAVLYPNGTTATVGLKGQTLQSSIPSPTSPAMPQGTGERSRNLVEGYISGCNINASGGLISNAEFNMFIAKVEQGKTYCLDTAITVAGYFTTMPTVGSVSYDAQRSSLSLSPFTAPIDGYLAYRKASSEKKAMMNEGNELLPYEPYGFEISISSASTTTPVYLGEVETTRKIKKFVLNGTESEDVLKMPSPNLFYYKVQNGLPLNSGACRCTHYINNQVPNVQLNNDEVKLDVTNVWGSTANVIVFKDTSKATLEDFKTWLQQQYTSGTPVTVWYTLGTSETSVINEPLMRIGDYADTLSNISIPVTAGGDTLSVGTTVQPSEVTVNYKGWHPVADVHERENGQWD